MWYRLCFWPKPLGNLMKYRNKTPGWTSKFSRYTATPCFKQTAGLASIILWNSHCFLYLNLLQTPYLSEMCQYRCSYGFYRSSYLFLECSGDLNLILALSFSLSLSGLQICQSRKPKHANIHRYAHTHKHTFLTCLYDFVLQYNIAYNNLSHKLSDIIIKTHLVTDQDLLTHYF